MRNRSDHWVMAASIALVAVFAGGCAATINSNDRPPLRTLTGGPFAPYPPGTCKEGVLPDAHCTPGATNPAVTPATIQQTICVSGWTSTVRPSVSVTAPEKTGSMAAYGAGTDQTLYEYDHLIPLEVGGATNDNLNLWPQPRAGAQGAGVKDSVENLLKSEVCAGTVSLYAAQYWIAHDWTRVKAGALPPVPAPGPQPVPAPTPNPPPPITTPVPTTPVVTTPDDSVDELPGCAQYPGRIYFNHVKQAMCKATYYTAP